MALKCNNKFEILGETPMSMSSITSSISTNDDSERSLIQCTWQSKCHKHPEREGVTDPCPYHHSFPPEELPKKQPSKICFYYKQYGNCKNGDKCTFLHQESTPKQSNSFDMNDMQPAIEQILKRYQEEYLTSCDVMDICCNVLQLERHTVLTFIVSKLSADEAATFTIGLIKN